MASYREIRNMALMGRQSGIQGRGAGYRAAKAIDASNRQWCADHPWRMEPKEVAELLDVPVASIRHTIEQQ